MPTQVSSRRMGRRALATGLASGVALGTARSVAASVPQDVRVLVGSPSGSPHEMHARLFASHLQRLRPQMRITVELVPRAGGKLAAKMLSDAAGDGRLIAMLSSGLMFAELLGEEGVAFSFARLRWIGSLDSDLRLLVLGRRSGITSLEALRQHKQPVTLAAISTASASWYEPLILNRILGIRLKPIPGYSAPARTAALMSGEIAASIGSLETFVDLLAQDLAVPVLRLNDRPLPGAATQPPLLVSAPEIAAHPELMTFLDAHFRFGRALCLGPRTSPEMAKAWRSLFDELMRDESYRRAVAAVGLALSPMPGDALQALVARVFDRAETYSRALHAALACGAAIAERGGTGC